MRDGGGVHEFPRVVHLDRGEVIEVVRADLDLENEAGLGPDKGQTGIEVHGEMIDRFAKARAGGTGPLGGARHSISAGRPMAAW